jgi:cyanuric acid amidohydrolase
MRIVAERFATAGPSDCTGLRAALAGCRLDAREVLAVIGKTEGNGGRNDFTRELAVRAVAETLAGFSGESRDEVENRVVLSFSGGCEGVASPHQLVLARNGAPRREPAPEKRLAVAVGHTRVFDAAEIGRLAMIEETARVVRGLMAELEVDAEDVHLVQVKGAIPDPPAGPAPPRCDMVHARAASALGVGLALGEIAPERLSDEAVCRDWDLYSQVASTSAKPGLARSEIVLFANSADWGGDLRIGHALMQDMLDVAAVHAALRSVGLSPVDGQLPAGERERLLAVFAKAEANPSGHIRGRRHTMLGDDDIGDTRYARCVVGSVVAAVTGEPAVYVSTRAEHHGPPGGGPVAVIARAAPTARP